MAKGSSDEVRRALLTGGEPDLPLEPKKRQTFYFDEDKASTRTRLVLNQPIFHDRSRVVLLGAESYTRALGYHGSAGSRASLMVVSADSLEPVCSCPSNRSVSELRWLQKDEKLLVAAGPSISLFDCTDPDPMAWLKTPAVLTEYDADIRDMSVQEGGRTILAGGYDQCLHVSQLGEGGSLVELQSIKTMDVISSVQWQTPPAGWADGSGGGRRTTSTSCCSVTYEHCSFEFLDLRSRTPRCVRYTIAERLYTHAYADDEGLLVLLAGATGKMRLLDLRRPQSPLQLTMPDDSLLDIGGLARCPTGRPLWCVAGRPGFSVWDMSFSSVFAYHQRLGHQDLSPSSESLTYAAFSTTNGDLVVTTSAGDMTIYDPASLNRDRPPLAVTLNTLDSSKPPPRPWPAAAQGPDAGSKPAAKEGSVATTGPSSSSSAAASGAGGGGEGGGGGASATSTAVKATAAGGGGGEGGSQTSQPSAKKG